jgi:predicted metal-dependent phosphoesterase TrpH
VSGPSAAREFIDLHMHSTASDGSRSPGDVVKAAHVAGLAAFALTDHDTIAGLAEARGAAEQLGLRLVPGVELSAVEGDLETHILGLHLSDLTELEHRLAGLREMRINRATRMVERLNQLGVPVKLEAVLAEAAGGAVGRPHIARALIAGRWVGDFREAFDRYLGNGKAAFVPKDKLPVSEAIALIHRAGGLAVLAHPGQQGTAERIAMLVGFGLDGIEILHPSHSWDDSQRLDALAGEFDLVRSGGSDWHGSTDGARSLGMMRVPANWLSAHDTRVAARRSRRVA